MLENKEGMKYEAFQGFVEMSSQYASLIGFAITCIVWWQVRGIRKSYLTRARLPEISKIINKQSAALLKELKGNKNRENCLVLVAELHGSLESLDGKIGNRESRAVKKILSMIKGGNLFFGRDFKDLTDDEVWAVYFEVS